MRAGFTLVELVVVILILGILAAVAAPRMFNTSAAATDNGLRQTLSTIRSAIDQYAVQNKGALPPCTGAGADFKAALQAYIRGPFPKCPVGPATNSNVIPDSGTVTSGVASPSDGWKFNTSDGSFICNFAGQAVSDSSQTYDSF